MFSYICRLTFATCDWLAYRIRSKCSVSKIEKKFTGIDQSSERASERVPFSTSYLELALAHARNSRVKKNDLAASKCVPHVSSKFQFRLMKSLSTRILFDLKSEISASGSAFCPNLRKKYSCIRLRCFTIAIN